MILSQGVFHETGIKINVEHVIMKDYPIQLEKDAHYIDTIYTKNVRKNDSHYQRINVIGLENNIPIKNIDTL